MGVVTVAGSQFERDVDPPSVVRERLEAFAGEVLGEAMNRLLSAAEYGHGGVALGGHRWGRDGRRSSSGGGWAAGANSLQ